MRPYPVIFCLVLTSCNVFQPDIVSSNTPQEMFSYVIESPVPDSVSDLQGAGDTWQGYVLYLRFQASAADNDRIIASGYEPINWSDAPSQLTSLPEEYEDKFSPPWFPTSDDMQKVYAANGISNDWTSSGEHYLVIDRSNKTVYFYGLGI